LDLQRRTFESITIGNIYEPIKNVWNSNA